MIVAIFILFILSIWAGMIILVSDLGLKNLNLKKLVGKDRFKTVVIYPHPDDETMASGGLIQILPKYGDVKVICVTKGEFGKEIFKLPPNELAQIRSQEFLLAMKELKVVNYEIWDFVDGTLIENLSKLENKIQTLIDTFNPDLFVTYERSGMYGHPDHIALSKVVNKLIVKNNIKAIYSTLPAKILRKIKLPKTINGVPIPEFPPQSKPEYKIFILNKYLLKTKAIRKYKSQKLSHIMPVEVLNLINAFEYYTTKHND